LVQKRRNAEDLFQLYQRMIARLPADRIVQNDHRYFATLTGRRPDPAGARTLVESEPQMLVYRITLALVRGLGGASAKISRTTTTGLAGDFSGGQIS
jgi:hypothetical protein